MAVSVDTVYQRVLAIANKEQRGYITPQEFNLFANQAQMDIFEQYFYDLNQFLRVRGNDKDYSDMVTILEEKISLFETSEDVQYNSTGKYHDVSALTVDVYRIGSVITSTNKICERVSAKEIALLNNSPLIKPSGHHPRYVLGERNNIYIYPNTITSDLTVNFIRKPSRVEWQYTVIQDKALWTGNSDFDFELHVSEETDIVFKVLELAGISIKDPLLYQAAAQEENMKIQQEKQ